MTQIKTALITGGSSGIGKALAFCFAKNGYDLILVARTKSTLEEVKIMIEEKYSISVLTIAHDLSLPGAAFGLYTQLVDKTIDVLVNNAGYGDYGPFIKSDARIDNATIHLNIESVTTLTKLILKDMLARGSGKILNVGSIASFLPSPLLSIYGATKAYILSFSESLRYELRDTPITVTVLCPGATATDYQNKTGYGSSNLVKLGMQSPETVAEAGYKALMKNKAIVITGIKNMLSVFLIRFAPRFLIVRIVYFLNKSS